MKLWEVFRFEVAYQFSRASTWLYVVLLLGTSFLMARESPSRSRGSAATS